MADPTLSEIQATLQRVHDLSARNDKIDALLLQLGTVLADMHEHQVGQAKAILDALVAAVREIKIDGPVVSMPEMPLQVNVPGNQWKRLLVTVNNDRMGRMESFTVDKVH